MLQARNDEQLIERYLLGQLPAAEAEGLEERGLADYDFFEHMLVIEDRLIDDYLAGQLAPLTRAQFERYFLASPRRRERVALTRALLQAVTQPVAAASVPAVTTAHSYSPATEQPSWQERWQRFFGWQTFNYAMTMVALLLLAFASWSFWEARRVREELARLSRERSAAEQRAQELKAQLNAQQGQNETLRQELERQRADLERLKAAEIRLQQSPAPASVIASLVLLPPTLRGSASEPIPQLTLNPDTAAARLTLIIDKELLAAFPHVRAELSRGGKLEWSQAGLQARRGKAGSAFVISLPATSLSAGSYLIRLFGSGAAGETVIADYSFKVEKK